MNSENKEDLSFVAIDFETANSDYSSICQIGLVLFIKGEIIEEISYLVDPQTHFDPINISIHNIRPQDVIGKPTFVEFYPILLEKINSRVLIHHQPFDHIALKQSCEKYNLEMPDSYWLDNAAVVRRAWEQFSVGGYGLKPVAQCLKIEFNHHDACEDARAAGLIFIQACLLHGKTIEMWAEDVERKRIKAPSVWPSFQKITGDLLKSNANCETIAENPFKGKKVVISGTYNIWPDRKDLAIIIKDLGADIDSSVTDRTNILCAGLGVGPSKVQKMQKNIVSGRDAVILDEDALIEILKQCSVDITEIQNIHISIKCT